MNVLSFEKRARPPAPEWRPNESDPEYYEILVDGVPLSEHLIAAGTANGFQPEATERGPEFLLPDEVDGERVENVGFFNYLCPAGWTRPEWQREWIRWLRCGSSVPTSDGRVPLLVCGFCGGCVATVVEVACQGESITWRRFQESTGDGERLVLPRLYEGLEFTFDRSHYEEALGIIEEDTKARS